MTNSLHFSEWRNCIRAQRKVNLCAPGAPKGPKVGMFVRQYEIVCANDAGRAPRKYPDILLLENIRNPVFGHFPSFPASSSMQRVTYLQYLTQCGVKPVLYSVRRSTQTELRKRIYAHTRRVVAFILLRRSRRVL